MKLSKIKFNISIENKDTTNNTAARSQTICKLFADFLLRAQTDECTTSKLYQEKEKKKTMATQSFPP